MTTAQHPEYEHLEKAKRQLKSAPAWLKMLIKEWNLDLMTVKVSINTPVASKEIEGQLAPELYHNGQVIITVEGQKLDA